MPPCFEQTGQYIRKQRIDFLDLQVRKNTFGTLRSMMTFVHKEKGLGLKCHIPDDI